VLALILSILPNIPRKAYLIHIAMILLISSKSKKQNYSSCIASNRLQKDHVPGTRLTPADRRNPKLASVLPDGQPSLFGQPPKMAYTQWQKGYGSRSDICHSQAVSRGLQPKNSAKPGR
jgi:hypothetical protein